MNSGHVLLLFFPFFDLNMTLHNISKGKWSVYSLSESYGCAWGLGEWEYPCVWSEFFEMGCVNLLEVLSRWMMVHCPRKRVFQTQNLIPLAIHVPDDFRCTFTHSTLFTGYPQRTLKGCLLSDGLVYEHSSIQTPFVWSSIVCRTATLNTIAILDTANGK